MEPHNEDPLQQQCCDLLKLIEESKLKKDQKKIKLLEQKQQAVLQQKQVLQQIELTKDKLKAIEAKTKISSFAYSQAIRARQAAEGVSSPDKTQAKLQR